MEKVDEDDLIATVIYCKEPVRIRQRNYAPLCSHQQRTQAHLVWSGLKSRCERAVLNVDYRSVYPGTIQIRAKNRPVEFSTSCDYIDAEESRHNSIRHRRR